MDWFYNMTQKINEEYSSPESDCLQVFDPEVGLAILGLYPEDKQWYRAEIVKILEDQGKCKVFYADFGNMYDIDYSQMRYLNYEHQILSASVNTYFIV